MGSLITVLDAESLVDLDLELDLDPEDSAWWAEQEAIAAASPAAPETDLAWIMGEIDRLESRATECWMASRFGDDPDPTESHALAGSLLRGLHASMLTRGHDQAVAYLADPVTVPGPAPLRVHLPLAGTRRSALAMALDTLAAWYLHLDTTAGDLVAHELLYSADQADDWGSASRAEYYDDEAAWLMACLDVAGDEMGDVIAFDPAEL